MVESSPLSHPIDILIKLFHGIIVHGFENVCISIQCAQWTGGDDVYVNYRLFADRGRICLNITDLGNRFDPAAFYEMYHDDSPGRHVGIRIVMNMAKEVLYFNTFSSNNLTVYLEADSAE